jgi:hypothetical protein
VGNRKSACLFAPLSLGVSFEVKRRTLFKRSLLDGTGDHGPMDLAVS